MEELGFTPSPAARRLSLGRTLTIGVVVSFLTRPQAAERLRGVDAVLTDSEFDLVIYNVESVQKRDHYLGTLAQSQRTDGLLVMSLPPLDAAVPQLGRSPVPVVFIDVHTPSIAAMPRVIGDDVAGGAMAARHLLDLGHTAIGFIGDAVEDPFGFTSSRDREAGLTRELARAGVSIPRRVDRPRRPRSLRGPRPRRVGCWPVRSAHGHLHRERYAGARRHRRRSRARAARARRPVGHRLRRHRGRRLRRPDDRPPAALRVRPSRARRSCSPRSRPAPSSHRSSRWRPSWWSVRPRRLRRRAVDETPARLRTR